MATSPSEFMVCGCCMCEPYEHNQGCWMAEAEATAEEAASSAAVFQPPKHRTLAALTALAAAGHLREVADGQALLVLLDNLTELGLLGPATPETS